VADQANYILNMLSLLKVSADLRASFYFAFWVAELKAFVVVEPWALISYVILGLEISFCNTDSLLGESILAEFYISFAVF